VHRGRGSSLPAREVGIPGGAAALPVQRHLGQGEQEGRDAERLVQLVEHELQEQLPER
jgi:hypothetical protein